LDVIDIDSSNDVSLNIDTRICFQWNKSKPQYYSTEE
jgi:hypothetical protein